MSFNFVNLHLWVPKRLESTAPNFFILKLFDTSRGEQLQLENGYFCFSDAHLFAFLRQNG